MRAVCCVCGDLSDAFEYFTTGWACQLCVSKASDIRTEYVIYGKTYTKRLKDAREEEPSAVRRFVAKM
jgi:hypothetical protein